MSRCCRLAVVARVRDLATGLWLGSALCFLKPVITIRSTDPIPAPFLLGCHELALEMAERLVLL